MRLGDKVKYRCLDGETIRSATITQLIPRIIIQFDDGTGEAGGDIWERLELSYDKATPLPLPG